MRLLSLLFLTLFSLVALAQEDIFLASDSNTTQAYDASIEEIPVVIQKVLYVNYETLPNRLFKGEIFPITLKTLSTLSNYQKINYKFSNQRGLTQISKEPIRSRNGRYLYDTFYFKVKGSHVKAPDINASLLFANGQFSPASLVTGEKIPTSVLNPNQEFSNVLAESFEITEYKTTQYSPRYNILIFSALATRSNLDDFKLTHSKKQDFETLETSVDVSSMTYFAIIPKKLESLEFTYFNLKSNKFVPLLIPIIVKDDSVSTQSDLTPIDHAHTQLKIMIASSFAFIAFIIFIIRRKWFYLPFVVVPLIYVAYAAIPVEYACIKKGSNIYLLPMENGTIFETTSSQYSLEVQGDIDNYVKVKLHNDNIGWVNHDDICSN